LIVVGPEGRRENQHYVPKVLLRNFASNVGAKAGKEKIWLFDKSRDLTANPNIRNIAAQFGFYDLKRGDFEFSIERPLGAVEDAVKSVLVKMMQQRSCAELSVEERAWFSIFCGVQFVRVENFRDQTKTFNAAVENLIRKSGGDPAQVQGYAQMNDEDVKEFSIQFLLRSLKEFPNHFAAKHWFIMEAAAGHTFYIGDNPIVLHNNRDFGPYGNLGLALPGIEIYLPISPTLTVAMWEFSQLPMFEKHLADARHTREQLLELRLTGCEAEIAGLMEKADQSIAQLETLTAAMKDNTRVTATPENVMFMNSLQVMYASRFVMSSEREFALAKRMCEDDPSYRSSLKMRFG
jgi:hypothetical protein